MTPVSGRSKKFRQRSSVVLPEPDACADGEACE